MPSLTLKITPKDEDTAQEIESSQTSPSGPPYSPITPTFCDSHRESNFAPFQTKATQPASKPIDFLDNPDVLALKSTISILKMQKITAIKDIETLQRIKMRALQDPQGFARALFSGEIKTRSDPLFFPETASDYLGEEKAVESSNSNNYPLTQSVFGPWEKLPLQQNIVRSPPINFAKYAVVSESLDKPYNDPVGRPSEGVPQNFGARVEYVETGEVNCRHCDIGIAAPYNPFRDKISKVGPRKSG